MSPLVVHIVHRFDYGGLENGLVNLVNHIPTHVARHAIIALTEATEIAGRIERPGVEVYALGKRPGYDLAAYRRLYSLLRRLSPDVVHTRNVGTLDCQIAAWLARVPRRIHGEHGWDVHDPAGRSPKYRWLRRALAPFVHRFVALSQEIERWLTTDVGVPADKVVRICNGVDTTRFRPVDPLAACEHVRTIGTVTRFSAIKDPLNTIDAFALLRSLGHRDIRFLVVGDGPLRGDVETRVADACLEGVTCLPGSTLDVAPYLARMDLFVLGSKREGISNTILEAMAAGLPVVATATGGNVELVEDGRCGFLVEPGCPAKLADAIARYVVDPALARQHGAAARERAERLFSLDAMVAGYSALYAAEA
jgi:sugar transferase (PEP-CTERM/EpsH1 system associated)